jgi:hypothetical protein
MTNVSWAHNSAYLLHGVQIGTQASVHGEDLLVDNGGDGQTVEAVGEGLPQLDIVSSLALIVEAIDAVDGSALMITTQNEEVFWVLDLVCQEETDGLKRLLAAVYVVAKEEVIGLGRETAVFEEAKEIIILAVNVTTNLDCVRWL